MPVSQAGQFKQPEGAIIIMRAPLAESTVPAAILLYCTVTCKGSIVTSYCFLGLYSVGFRVVT